jgi:glycosyltransferase involved in cell wall biosynthesis
MRRLAFAIPGDLAALTGGYAYDRALAAHLPATGWTADIVGLSGEFPFPTAQTLRETEARLLALPARMPILVDGLAYGALRPEFLKRSDRRWAALVHHPLALETGLTQGQAQRLRENETAALAAARLVIATSPHTMHALGKDYGVSADRLRCATPGTEPATGRRHGRTSPPVLLTVASLIPRKAHDVLVDALARLRDLPWHALFVGDSERDPQTAARIRRRIDATGLAGRIEITGPLQGEALEAAYRRADMFVLPSRHEGYGMVFAEALAHGLPIVACAAGAVVDTVPPDAGRLAPPDDPDALARLLRTLLTDDTLHAVLSQAAWRHGQTLPSWTDTAAAVAAALDGMGPA